MTTFSTGGSAVAFTTSGSAVSFTVTDAANTFSTSAVLTPGAHAASHGAGGSDPITTLGTVTTTLATITGGTATTFTINTATFGTATMTLGTATTLQAGTATFTAASVGNVSNTEIGYLDGVTSPLQGQIDAKAPLASPTFTGTATIPTASIGTVTATLGTVTTLVASTATLSAGTAAGLVHTGQSIFAAGSAAGPSIAFTGDTNTGIYSPGADQVGIATAGTARVIVNASGQVGIGASPSQKLHLESGSMLIKTTSNDAASEGIILRKDRAGAIVSSGDAVGALLFQGYDGGANRTLGVIRASVDATPGASDMPGRLTFWTTPDGSTTDTERMRIDNAGLITGTGTSLGAWTAYTPTFTQTGSLTTSFLYAAYCRIGKVVHAKGILVFNNAGTGGATLTMTNLPVSANLGGYEVIGQARIYDASTTTSYLAAPIAYSSTDIRFVGDWAAAGFWGGTPNLAIASGDQIEFRITYEAA